ncbi:hypothetical protein ACFSC4_22420 [Deinococcus malanensis]|nr:hypothetical protein [Deinococcus malanensis]
MFLALLVTSCTPATSGSPTPASIGLVCTGSSIGTLTRAESELSVVINKAGEVSGSFTNNGTVFAANGKAAVSEDARARTLVVSQLTLSLDSTVAGRAGITASMGAVRTGVGLVGALGSSGNLNGVLDEKGAFTGTFRGLQGTYRTLMGCGVS